jgi:hypothetical protein
MMVLQRQQRALQEVWDIFQQKSKTLAEIKNILLNPMQFHGVEEDVLERLCQQETIDRDPDASSFCSKP